MIAKIETDQSRLRNNIKSLENVKSDTLIERYMSEFEKHEDNLKEIHTQMEKTQSDIDC